MLIIIFNSRYKNICEVNGNLWNYFIQFTLYKVKIKNYYKLIFILILFVEILTSDSQEFKSIQSLMKLIKHRKKINTLDNNDS